MTARYQKQIAVPDGFPILLKDFAREVLRQQPENIYTFGAQHFQRLHAQQQAGATQSSDAAAAASNGRPDVSWLSASELEDLILSHFLKADSDRNGYLDPREFAAAMEQSGLFRSEAELLNVLAECDENEDGNIQYREFLPIMVQVIHGMRAKALLAASRNADEAQARSTVQTQLLHGMPRAELEAMMRGVFRAADVNGDRRLDRKEFKNCLRHADVGLTRQEINLLLAKADRNGDGSISYEEFLPLCFNILVERFSDELVREKQARSADDIEVLLVQAFAAEDRERTGLLLQRQIKGVLTDLSREGLGLTRMQVLTLMSEAEPDEEGYVNYRRFASGAAHMIHSLVDVSHQADRAAAIESLSRSAGVQQLRNLSRDAVRGILEEAFRAADEQGAGALERSEVIEVLQELASSQLGLTPRDVNCLMAALEENSEGAIEYEQLISFTFDVLQHLDREEYVQRVAAEAGK
ncbi:troponin C [Klebsormidium nitens]|uniref:Troponin C n=1 Tax=Klebsormidium nitens TaxID=105231 RepID=A0A1Y1HXM2_KLENI|nr:troponin C [Klebsormidium nitens]|eukprot:GAQ80608.1 troponin C [Klebsormidium nitens]